MANEINLRIPLKGPVDFRLIGGIRTNVTFTRDEPPTSFRNGTKHQGLAEAINNLEETIKPIYFSSILGIESAWKRISLKFLLDKNLGNSITRPLRMYGETSTFLNTTNTFTLQANYKILPWPKKGK